LAACVVIEGFVLVIAEDEADRNLAESLQFRRLSEQPKIDQRVLTKAYVRTLGEMSLPGLVQELIGLDYPPASRELPRSSSLQVEIKLALRVLNEGALLARSRLIELRCLARCQSSRAQELRKILLAEISGLERSSNRQDSEAGKVLMDYYGNRIGTHEVVAEKLGLPRATFYRRLHRGLRRLAERIASLDNRPISLAETSPGPRHRQSHDGHLKHELEAGQRHY
jgi:hypothetical protein